MNTTLVLTIINGVLAVVGTKLNVQGIQAIINMLVEAIPLIIKEYKEVLPIVKNIISVLSSSDDITPEQLDQLDVMEAEIDANWNDAVDQYLQQHNEGG